MQKKQMRSRIYISILDSLEKEVLTREQLIERIYAVAGLNKQELLQTTPEAKKQFVRSCVGEALSVMEGNGIIAVTDGEKYKLLTDKPVAIRVEKCEKEILSMLTKGSYTRKQIKDRLSTLFATKKTKSTKDDETLYRYVAQILKRLRDEKIIRLQGETVSLFPHMLAKVDDRKEMLELKNIFLLKLHTKGGEFFEQYFVTLLTKFLTITGKKVLEASVTAGSDDGGIDGIVRTEDNLGFRETVMIQTKNRNVITNETDIRCFYGAVCVKRGTRGIYAITSDFHQNARALLDSLDDCIGLNGDAIFEMAVKCRYGIVKTNGGFSTDSKIFG